MAAKWESQKKGFLDDSEWIGRARSISARDLTQLEKTQEVQPTEIDAASIKDEIITGMTQTYRTC